MTEKKLKIAVVGLGTNGSMHFKQLQHMDSVEIIAVADPLIESRKETLNLSGIPLLTKDYHDILVNDEVAAIFFFTPSSQHLQNIADSAKAHKNIFCEKPLSKDGSIAECKATLEKVKEAGIKLQIGFNRRFDPQFKQIHERVKNGEIGTPQIVKVVARDPFVIPYDFIKNSGGLIQDFTAHDFDMLRYQAGSDIDEVFIESSILIDPKLAEFDDVDTLTASVKFKNGALGLIDESRKAVYGYDQRVEVFGPKGMLKAENVSKSTVEYYNEQNVALKKPLDYYLNRFEEAYLEEKSLFVKSVLEDLPIICTGEDALKAMCCSNAALESQKIGRPVKIQY
ncbi:Gfo/Idh/MocA family protein [Liquorilactobacillus mali]|uniref:Gfo/Idh/MocA family protein n=1 Tax=Liquorilactobacillus mali TaxID=1618 RepID=UPI002952C92D|nr:Gfo/Idh/MocA family oxidoreductase [Liquorilactobacillus mali]MDV7757524.1 inositol 2-dehydrogenase [Liquorilactobacillus mali]